MKKDNKQKEFRIVEEQKEENATSENISDK